MKTVSDFSELTAATGKWLDAQASATTAAMREAGTGALGELRAQVKGAGLGNKLANTWRMKVYPGQPSLDPAVYIWTKAPKIIGAFDQGAVILPTDGRHYLAIPTKNVPFKGRGKLMTPLDVETSFNQDLILRKKPNGNILAFVDVNFARWSLGKGRFAKRKGSLRPKPRLVLMFTLVRVVRLGRRLDVDHVGDAWSDRIAELIDKNWRA